MSEFGEAQGELDKLSKQWQTEIADQYKEINSMHETFQAEAVLLTAEMKEERQLEIQNKEEEVKAHQLKIFGANGLYFLKKKELIEPLQDKIFEAVEKVCKTHKLSIMFDKSGELIMVYTDPRHDYTDYVLEELGLGDPNDVIK